MIDGILLINKEKGITSYDVIRKLKKILPKGQKIGHAGTLDPFATGLLIILLGKGTKLMDTFHGFKKEYVVEVEFGYATDTQDSTGTKTDVNKEQGNIPEEEIISCIGDNFIGDLQQIPPIYSAKKISGKKAYELAREGKNVTIQPKVITVYEFEIIKYDFPFCSFNIISSTGTYIRTLVHDLGIKMGTFATAIELKRKSIRDFSLENAYDSGKISEDHREGILREVIKLDDIKL